jgi:hypothetical protein
MQRAGDDFVPKVEHDFDPALLDPSLLVAISADRPTHAGR